jgi:dihydrolipoamide dehydrogenase
MRYDALIIGGGPGGFEASIRISQAGGNALLVEKENLGGVCTNRGCIPTKAMVAGCNALDTVGSSMELGIDAKVSGLDLGVFFKRRDRIVSTLRRGVEKIVSDSGVKVVNGEAEIVSKDRIRVGKEEFEGGNIIIASGSVPTSVPGVDFDGEYVISGDEASCIRDVPDRVLIIGGGFIGCEYAGIFSRLGANVTLIEALDRLLPGEDEDISRMVEKGLAKRVDVLTGMRVEGVDKDSRTVKANGESHKADLVIVAAGRRIALPNGVKEIGVKVSGGLVAVDEHMMTSIPGVYAIGDVCTKYKLAHVASAHARVCAANIMGKEVAMDESAIPWCVFTMPEAARIGLRESDVENPVVGRGEYIANGMARCLGQREGFCKVIAKDGLIAGVHIYGAHASELVGEALMIIGLKPADVIKRIHPHPTLTEVLYAACEDMLGK